jgi:hypothetical protein
VQMHRLNRFDPSRGRNGSSGEVQVTLLSRITSQWM